MIHRLLPASVLPWLRARPPVLVPILVAGGAPLTALLLCAAGTPSNGSGGARPDPPDDRNVRQWSDILTEEQFKALHTLRKEGPQTLHGTPVTITAAPGGRAITSTGYLSLPESVAVPVPGIVVIHEWWGLNDNIRHWADRLAADGYAALAVDLYGGRVAESPDSAMRYMQTVNDSTALSILLAADRFLRRDPRVRSERTGVIGWCFGGGWSLRMALADSDLSAAVLYYGRLVTDPKELKRIKAPVLGIFGNKDPSIPPDAVTAFDRALTEAGVPHEILRYDAKHAFANPSAGNYDEKAAEDAWKHVRPFLARNLRPGRPARQPSE